MGGRTKPCESPLYIVRTGHGPSSSAEIARSERKPGTDKYIAYVLLYTRQTKSKKMVWKKKVHTHYDSKKLTEEDAKIQTRTTTQEESLHVANASPGVPAAEALT